MVTRKGQVTIPVSKRKKYGIREGMQVRFKDIAEGLVIQPITIENLAGVDAGKISLSEMKKALDDMRRKDRY